MTESKPGALQEIYGMLFNPGGDVGAIHRAAATCRNLAGDLRRVTESANTSAEDLKVQWQGPAADGFQGAWGKFHPSVIEYTGHLDDLAKSLDSVAKSIKEAQDQARKFAIEIGATLVAGAVMTFFSFGFSDVAAGAAVEADMGMLALAMERIGALVAGEAGALAALESAMATTAIRMGAGALGTMIGSAGIKAIVHKQNPFDPASWDAKDGSNILNGAILTSVMGGVAKTGRSLRCWTGPVKRSAPCGRWPAAPGPDSWAGAPGRLSDSSGWTASH